MIVVGQLRVISEVIFCVESANPRSELAHHIRILRYLRLYTRKMVFWVTFEVMYRTHKIF